MEIQGLAVVLAADGCVTAPSSLGEWRRPGRIRSIDWQTLKLLPEQLTIREMRVRIRQPGFRCRSMIVVSTLLAAEAGFRCAVAALV
jgi:hypothetical protein